MTVVGEVLSRVTDYEGITLALLVGRDGLIIDGISKNTDQDLENMAAADLQLDDSSRASG